MLLLLYCSLFRVERPGDEDCCSSIPSIRIIHASVCLDEFIYVTDVLPPSRHAATTNDSSRVLAAKLLKEF